MKKLIAALACLATLHAHAAITVQDDDGKPVTLQKPARRIVALAPHVTEMLFAAGAAERVIAVVKYSDYPPAAKDLPQVGSDRQIDRERIAALKPDLIVVWLHGSSERQIEQIRALGIPMFHSEPRKLDDIATNLVRLGKLMGTESVAEPLAASLRQRLAALSARYAARPPVRMFYQVWDKPLHTLNGGHILSDAMRTCGGVNIFASLKVTAPVVSIESVLQEDPEAIVHGERSSADVGLKMWAPYSRMTAVRRANLFALDASLLNRSGPRLVDGAEALCERLELARQRRHLP